MLFCLITNVIQSQVIYNIDTRYPVHTLRDQLLLIPDQDNIYTPNQILEDSTLHFFIQQKEQRFLKLGTTYWGKITVITSDSLNGWTLNFEDQLNGLPAWCRSNGKIDVYAFFNEDLIFHRKTGVEYKSKERDIQENLILNKVRLNGLPVNRQVDLIIKAQGDQMGYPAYFNATIRSPEQAYYHQIFGFGESFNMFMFGITFIIFIYHFLMFLYLRQRVFLWFSIWLLFCCLTMAMSVGFIIGGLAEFRLPIWLFIANGILYSFWFFGRSFINSKEKFPKLDRFILMLSFAMLIEILMTICYVVFFKPQAYFTGVGIHYHMIVVYAVLSGVLSLVLIFRNDSFARYFGFGAVIISIAFLIGGLWSLGIFRVAFDPYAWGMFLQIIIYSFGIAYRQRTLLIKSQNERLKAQRNFAEMQRIKDLDEMKSRFFTNLSHEFRTPLSLITGPLELARQTMDYEDASVKLPGKTLAVIQKNANRLTQLIDQLLELARFESGKVHLKLVKGELVHFVKSLTSSFESMAESNGISFNTHFPKNINDVYFDKDKLEKIISNLLSNAFKYTPAGGAVTLTMEHTKDHFILEVSDTGKGMSKEEMQHIFERFYRVENTESKGTGIGLALTKELVNLHNGQINVSSREGEGTTVKVRIPHDQKLLPDHMILQEEAIIDLHSNIKDNSFYENRIEQDSESLPVLQNQNSDQRLILLVEDNEDLRQHITNIISSHYRIIIAENGIKGERLAIEHIPDVVISDVMMPGKDGYQLCNDLKTNSKTSHIPIIMLTAKAGQKNKMEGLSLGADAYLVKPFNANELLIRIKNLIDVRKKTWDYFNNSEFVIVDNLNVQSIDDDFLQKVTKTIKDNLDNELFSVEKLSQEVGFSRSQLHRKLKALSNKSANQFIVEIRLNEAKRMLEYKVGTVSEIAYSVGYTNMSFFTKSFKEKFGILPSKV